MMEGLKPYANLKNSNVPWLGDVPAHWEVRRLKHSARLNPSKTEASSELSPDDIVSFLPMECVSTDGHVHNRTAIASSVWSGFTYFRRADVLVAKITPCFENGKGACLDSLETEYGFGSTEFHVLRASEAVLPKFLYRITTLPDFRTDGADAMNGAAGQQRVPVSFVANYPIALPPISEQSSIVRFLDHADRKIRRYIRAKQKLIKLLEEQKQAIIHRAVTRGLDPNVRLKPSGVEWLGDVPEHWELCRNGRLFIKRSKPGAEGLPVFEVSLRTGIRTRTFGMGDRKQRMTQAGEYQTALKGDLVYNMMRMWQGACGICDSDGLVSPAYVVAAPLRGTHSQYFLRLFKTSFYKAEIDKYSYGIVKDRNRLYWDNFKRMPSLRPPMEEQERIVEYLDQRCNVIDKVISINRNAQKILIEFRTRLIADVVTGKLDVREAAARLEDVEDASDEQDETAFDASLDDTDADADDDATGDEEA